MNKYSAIVILITLVICASALFQIKYSVQYLHKDVEELKRQLSEEKSSIHTLKAEWAFLNNPRRLKILVKRYLNMQEVQMSQINNFQFLNQTNNIKPVHYNIKKKVKWRYKDKYTKFINNIPDKNTEIIIEEEN